MSVYKQRKSQFWWCEFKVHGKKIRKSTGTTNRREAEVQARRLRVEAETSCVRVGSLDFQYMIALDVDRAISEGADLNREATILGLWKPLARFFVSDDTITTHRLREYIIHRRTSGVRGQTIRRELQALRRGLRLAEYACPIEWPRVKKDPPKQSLRGKLHPPDIILAWLGELSADARDEAIFAMHTGLRAAEIKRVRGEWVEPAPPGVPTPAILRLPAEATKTRTERVVGLSHEALAILRKRGGYFSQENHRKCREAASKRLGMTTNVTLRDLRHMYATLALQHTGDAAAVQAALGHTDLRTTQVYQSSTIARTATASDAVSKALRPIPGTHTEDDVFAKCAEVWRAMRGSNPRPSTPEAIPAIAAAVSACFYRLALIRQWLEMQQNTPGVLIPEAHTRDDKKVA